MRLKEINKIISKKTKNKKQIANKINYHFIGRYLMQIRLNIVRLILLGSA